MNKTWIFDYDDTLAPNQHDYSVAQLKFAEFLIEKLGYRAPDVPTIMALEAAIDDAAATRVGFPMERFPTSFVETYKQIVHDLNKFYYPENPENGYRLNQEDMDKAYKIGMLAFDPERYKEQGLLDGADITLDTLCLMKDELILLTKGDERVQRIKLEANNIYGWFKPQNVHIVGKKSPEIISEIVGSRDKSKVYHVGNSIRSDVKPGLAAGIKVIYIPCETWAYEKKHEGVPIDPNLIRLDKIIEIKERYDQF